MDRNAWLRRRAIRFFQDKPGVFSKLLSVHTGTLPLSSLSVREMIDFGWKLLRT